MIFDSDYPISRQFRKQGYFERGTLDDVWEIPRERRNIKTHTAVFPEKLVETILHNFSTEGQIVYDPFMGTGTTAIVAKKMDRYYIGSELSSAYCAIAEENLTELDETYRLSVNGKVKSE